MDVLEVGISLTEFPGCVTRLAVSALGLTITLMFILCLINASFNRNIVLE